MGVGKGMKETEDQETGKRWNVRVDSTMRGETEDNTIVTKETEEVEWLLALG